MKILSFKSLAEGQTADDGRIPAVLTSRISHRTFLKALMATVGGAGLAQFASSPRDAEATYIPGNPSPDVVDTDLTVQGNLTVCNQSGQGSVTVGNATPQGRLNVGGDVWVGGQQAIDANGVVIKSYYAQ